MADADVRRLLRELRSAFRRVGGQTAAAFRLDRQLRRWHRVEGERLIARMLTDLPQLWLKRTAAHRAKAFPVMVEAALAVMHPDWTRAEARTVALSLVGRLTKRQADNLFDLLESHLL
jgi:hypothetical protein